MNITHKEIIDYLCCGNSKEDLACLYYSIAAGQNLKDLEDEVAEWVQECRDNGQED